MSMKWLGWLLVLFTLARLLMLNAYPLLDPTEGRYAEIPREMIAANDWVVPRLGEDKFWGKPPLQFWATILSFEVFGQSEFSARLPSLCFSALAVALTFSMARRLWGTEIGMLAAFILATSGLLYLYAGLVTTDTSLLATITLAMVAFTHAMQDPTRPLRLMWGTLFFVGLGLSLLAKGLVGPVLVVVPILVWAIWQKQIRQVLCTLPWKSGTLLALAISVPWHLWCEFRTPGFLWYYFVGEHLERFLYSGWKGDLYGNPHKQTLGTIWFFFIAASIPWIVIFPAILHWARARKIRLKELAVDPWESFLLLWLLLPMFFFTFSRNIMPSYVLPCLPPFAALTAKVFAFIGERSKLGGTPWFLTPRTLILSSLFTPLIMSVVSFGILPSFAVHKSQKELAEAFLHLDVDGGAKLVYVGFMPWSGAFYTNGRATEIPRERTGAPMSELSDSVQDYFVFRAVDFPLLAPEALQKTEHVGEFGKLVLRREPDERDLSPEVLRAKS
jgi:4-amino-4-deoxy-L-arabinose transferase-like glycosyltransferase